MFLRQNQGVWGNAVLDHVAGLKSSGQRRKTSPELLLNNTFLFINFIKKTLYILLILIQYIYLT